MIWGGLRPILSTLIIDVLTLSGLVWATWTPIHKKKASLIALVASCLLTLATAGLTSRWTLTFPMIPFLALQGLRRISFVSERWPSMGIAVLSTILILMGGALSVLFPAVELPPIDGPFNVGIVDFYLPVDMANYDSKGCSIHSSNGSTHVPVRILYPTLEKPEYMPLLKPHTSDHFCRETMMLGAPPPLKGFEWMLHTWKLTGVQAKRNARLLPASEQEQLPIVIFSHGLGGTSDIYSYQTMALAAHGFLVLSITHQDGSAPVVQRSDGSILTFDHKIANLGKDGKWVEYARERRARTDDRVRELLTSTEALLRLNEEDLLDLDQLGLSLVGRLQKDHTFFMGHSFGGATALTAAKRRPDLVKGVVAHEPAIDWMPDDAMKSFFADDRLDGLAHKFNGGIGGYEDENLDADVTSSVHDVDMLVLSSNEWRDKDMGSSHIIEDMHRNGRLGLKNGNSSYSVVKGAHHTEFSDTSVLTPLWLARATGITGKRNPHDTAREISQETRAFIDILRS
jgi:pimeloyl-ACP methyl ester carboxylesterase